jgi:hypothetical protein
VLEADVLVEHPEIHPQRVQAVVEGHQHGIDRERGVEQDRGAEEDRDGAPWAMATGAADGRPREDQGLASGQATCP